MTQRTLAGLLAVRCCWPCGAATLWLPLPYVTYEPGSTVDVLGKTEDQEIIQVNGHKTYRDDGQLRMTTVYVSSREREAQPLRGDERLAQRRGGRLPLRRRLPDGRDAEEDREQGRSRWSLAGPRDRGGAARARLRGHAGRQGHRRHGGQPGRRRAQGRATCCSRSTATPIKSVEESARWSRRHRPGRRSRSGPPRRQGRQDRQGGRSRPTMIDGYRGSASGRHRLRLPVPGLGQHRPRRSADRAPG